jgi:hypothetical protein
MPLTTQYQKATYKKSVSNIISPSGSSCFIKQIKQYTLTQTSWQPEKKKKKQEEGRSWGAICSECTKMAFKLFAVKV